MSKRVHNRVLVKNVTALCWQVWSWLYRWDMCVIEYRNVVRYTRNRICSKTGSVRVNVFWGAFIKPTCSGKKYYTGLFEMIVGVLTTCHLVLQMQPHVISFYGFTSRIRFMFLLFPQVSRNWRYESEPPLKPSPLTCYIQFGKNSIIVLIFVESQRVHI